MIELAPHNAYGLALANPIMVAAGCAGFADLRTQQIHRGVGAIVTADVAAQSRRVGPPRPVETAAGLVWPTPWPVASLRRIREAHASAWEQSTTPIVLGVAADHATVAAELEGVSGIAALELGFDAIDLAPRTVAAVRGVSLLPILVRLAIHEATPERVAALASAGADAITLCARPRAATSAGAGVLIGPATLPLVVAAVAELAAQPTLPIVACGGVTTSNDVQMLLAAGATAVQIGSALLANPFAAAQIAANW